MEIRAAVLREQGKPLAIETIDLAPPGPGEVLVAVHVAGVCHSDWHAVSGDWPMRVPLVPGHEGAGIVRALGDGVTRVFVGDRVVFCWAPACGACAPCREGRPLLCERLDKTTYRNRLPFGGTRLKANDQDVMPFLGTGCFATHVVVPQEALIRIDTDAPFEALAAVGCAVITGVGAVTNAARVTPGATVAVIGAGGVGLNVVQGASLAHAARIIALDRSAAPLELARTLGATDLVHAAPKISDAVRDRTNGRGADYVFDTVGSPDTIPEAVAAARKGGTVVVTGLARVDARAQLPLFHFVMHEKRLIGSVYGSGDPLRDVPNLLALYQKGRLKLGQLAARQYPLEQVNDALAALAADTGGRGILRIG